MNWSLQLLEVSIVLLLGEKPPQGAADRLDVQVNVHVGFHEYLVDVSV